MRFLITRPQADAERLAEQLRALGHEALISPLMKVVCRQTQAEGGAGEPDAPDAPDMIDGTIITSRNALFCLQQAGTLAGGRSAIAALPLFAVGEASAALALELGFRQVLQGPGNAEQLLETIREYFSSRAPQEQPLRLYHPGGVKKAFDMQPGLAQMNIGLVRRLVYETPEADSFTPQARAALLAGDLRGVILLSPRSARIFQSLLEKDAAFKRAPPITALCLSQKVADSLEASGGFVKKVSAQPNMPAMLRLIRDISS